VALVMAGAVTLLTVTAFDVRSVALVASPLIQPALQKG
jgi:hypothetical protein